MKIHVVQKGETLWKIAKKYGLELETVIAANPQIQNPDAIDVGMQVKVPTASKKSAVSPTIPTAPTQQKAKEMVKPTAPQVIQPEVPKAQPIPISAPEIPKMPLPKMELPKMPLPKMQMPQLPQMQMPQIQAPQMQIPQMMPYCPPLAPKPLPASFYCPFPQAMPMHHAPYLPDFESSDDLPYSPYMGMPQTYAQPTSYMMPTQPQYGYPTYPTMQPFAPVQPLTMYSYPMPYPYPEAVAPTAFKKHCKSCNCTREESN